MEQQKISITLPNDIVHDIDALATKLTLSQSGLIESIIKMYLAERRRIENKDNLMNGYAEMGKINLSISEEFFNSDQATQDAYEQYLMGCE